MMFHDYFVMFHTCNDYMGIYVVSSLCSGVLDLASK